MLYQGEKSAPWDKNNTFYHFKIPHLNSSVNASDDYYFLKSTGNLMYSSSTDEDYNIIVAKTPKGMEPASFTDADFKEPCTTYPKVVQSSLRKREIEETTCMNLGMMKKMGEEVERATQTMSVIKQ